MSEEARMLETEMLLQEERGVATASPSVPYVKYILEDSYVPKELPEYLRAVAYDKEMALSNLTKEDMMYVRMVLQRAELDYINGRPALASNYKERILLDVIGAKQLLKLCRSRDGGFERKQETTQTIVRMAQAGTPPPAKERRWWVFGKRKGGPAP